MHDKTITSGDVLAFWNSRAGLGQWAGTRDVLAKQLEIEALAARARDGMRILEIGCGNGITAMEIARRHRVNITAFDFAEDMITAARGLAAGQEFKGTVEFQVGDVTQMGDYEDKFDLIYTERVLINLLDWPSQERALVNIAKLLAPGGAYAMCENSQDSLEALNVLRERVGLPAVVPPWHNRYFRDAELGGLRIAGLSLEVVEHYSSTYYFLSRVVNAALAAAEGKEPPYDSPVNRLALQLPSIGELGQGRLWLWRRAF